MLELDLPKEILASFAGTLLALLSAGFVWFLKSAHEKHRLEVLALAKFERIFANNLTILKDNFDFLDKWIGSLKTIVHTAFTLRITILTKKKPTK